MRLPPSPPLSSLYSSCPNTHPPHPPTPTADFAHEIGGSLRFFVDYARGKPGTHGPRVAPVGAGDPLGHAPRARAKMDFGEAFGLSPRPYARPPPGMRMSVRGAAAGYGGSGGESRLCASACGGG